MPFDCSFQSIEVLVIDKVIELLQPPRRALASGRFSDNSGRHCLLGTMRRARRELCVKGGMAGVHIRYAISVLDKPNRKIASGSCALAARRGSGP
jgi:hypothetical protein